MNDRTSGIQRDRSCVPRTQSKKRSPCGTASWRYYPNELAKAVMVAVEERGRKNGYLSLRFRFHKQQKLTSINRVKGQ